jgi:hypothetical protein
MKVMKGMKEPAETFQTCGVGGPAPLGRGVIEGTSETSTPENGCGVLVCDVPSITAAAYGGTNPASFMFFMVFMVKQD